MPENVTEFGTIKSDKSPYKGVVGLLFTARMGRALFHRARSASKKGGPIAPSASVS